MYKVLITIIFIIFFPLIALSNTINYIPGKSKSLIEVRKQCNDTSLSDAKLVSMLETKNLDQPSECRWAVISRFAGKCRNQNEKKYFNECSDLIISNVNRHPIFDLSKKFGEVADLYMRRARYYESEGQFLEAAQLLGRASQLETDDTAKNTLGIMMLEIYLKADKNNVAIKLGHELLGNLKYEYDEDLETDHFTLIRLNQILFDLHLTSKDSISAEKYLQYSYESLLTFKDCQIGGWSSYLERRIRLSNTSNNIQESNYWKFKLKSLDHVDYVYEEISNALDNQNKNKAKELLKSIENDVENINEVCPWAIQEWKNQYEDVRG